MVNTPPAKPQVLQARLPGVFQVLETSLPINLTRQGPGADAFD